jgi:hypothetical protein
MIATTTRRCSTDELEAYLDIMGLGPVSWIAGMVLSVIVGAVAAAATLGGLSFFVPMASAWVPALVVGALALSACLALIWFVYLRENWWASPPGDATEIVATANAAWMIDDDSPVYRLVLRLGPEAFLIVNQSVWVPHFGGEEVTTQIGSGVRVVLVGEGRFRCVVSSALSGPPIPVAPVEIYPWAEEGPGSKERNATPDGLYAPADLPRSIGAVVLGG